MTLHSILRGDSAVSAPSPVRLRRRRYLARHPEYFDASNLELADPLLYDCLVRRFQNASERETEIRRKGYPAQLEADLIRSEAKLAAVSSPDSKSPLTCHREANGEIRMEYIHIDQQPETKAEGMQIWQRIMTQRFMNGHDTDFDYTTVDMNEDYDDLDEETRIAEDKYYGDQLEEYVESETVTGQTGIQDF